MFWKRYHLLGRGTNSLFTLMAQEPHPNEYEAKVSAIHVFCLLPTIESVCVRQSRDQARLSGHAYHTLILLPEFMTQVCTLLEDACLLSCN